MPRAESVFTSQWLISSAWKKENAYCRDALQRKNGEAKELRAERTLRLCLRHNRRRRRVYDVTSVTLCLFQLVSLEHNSNIILWENIFFFLYCCLFITCFQCYNSTFQYFYFRGKRSFVCNPLFKNTDTRRWPLSSSCHHTQPHCWGAGVRRKEHCDC